MYLQRQWWCLSSFFPSPRPTHIHWNCLWVGAQLEHLKHWNSVFRCHYRCHYIRCSIKKSIWAANDRMEHLWLLHLSLKGNGGRRGSVLSVSSSGDGTHPTHQEAMETKWSYVAFAKAYPSAKLGLKWWKKTCTNKRRKLADREDST